MEVNGRGEKRKERRMNQVRDNNSMGHPRQHKLYERGQWCTELRQSQNGGCAANKRRHNNRKQSVMARRGTRWNETSVQRTSEHERKERTEYLPHVERTGNAPADTELAIMGRLDGTHFLGH